MIVLSQSHVLRGLSPALNPICFGQTFGDSLLTSAETNCTVALRPHWWVLLSDLFGSLGAVDAPQGDGA